MMLGERRGSTKYEVCSRCHRPVMMVFDHGLGMYLCPDCDL